VGRGEKPMKEKKRKGKVRACCLIYFSLYCQKEREEKRIHGEKKGKEVCAGQVYFGWRERGVRKEVFWGKVGSYVLPGMWRGEEEGGERSGFKKRGKKRGGVEAVVAYTSAIISGLTEPVKKGKGGGKKRGELPEKKRGGKTWSSLFLTVF